MHLVAVVSSDPDLALALRGYHDDARRFLLHLVPAGRPESWLPALRALDFAGALVLSPGDQAEALDLADRASLEASEVRAADTLVVTQAGIVADFHLGRAVAQALRSRVWDPRGASAVILGGGREAHAVARELASLGARHLTLLAASRPEAERMVPRLAASTDVVATVPDDPVAGRLLERTDLLVRVDETLRIPATLVGPHLTLVDLVPGTMSQVRRQALAAGALTLDRRDIEAHRLHLALGHVLGAGVAVEPLLQAMLRDH
jgi:shikimate 5-dehydrogenase